MKSNLEFLPKWGVAVISSVLAFAVGVALTLSATKSQRFRQPSGPVDHAVVYRSQVRAVAVWLPLLLKLNEVTGYLVSDMKQEPATVKEIRRIFELQESNAYLLGAVVSAYHEKQSEFKALPPPPPSLAEAHSTMVELYRGFGRMLDHIYVAGDESKPGKKPNKFVFSDTHPDDFAILAEPCTKAIDRLNLILSELK